MLIIESVINLLAVRGRREHELAYQVLLIDTQLYWEIVRTCQKLFHTTLPSYSVVYTVRAVVEFGVDSKMDERTVQRGAPRERPRICFMAAAKHGRGTERGISVLRTSQCFDVTMSFRRLSKNHPTAHHNIWRLLAVKLDIAHS